MNYYYKEYFNPIKEQVRHMVKPITEKFVYKYGGDPI